MKKKIKIKSIKNLDNIKNESKICVFNFFGKIAIRTVCRIGKSHMKTRFFQL